MDENEIIEKNLENIEPGTDDFIKRRIYHINFAKIVYWLWSQSKKNDFIYVNDLAKFTKLTKTRAHSILNELCNVFLLERRHIGNLTEYWFVKNGEHPLIEKYLENAKKILGLE